MYARACFDHTEPLDGAKSVHSVRRGAQCDAGHRASAGTTPMGGFGPPKAGFSRFLDSVGHCLWSIRPRHSVRLASKRENPVKCFSVVEICSRIRKISAIAAALSALGFSACSQEYYQRSETVYLGAGDAVRRNIAIHTINPTPDHAYRTHIHTSGQRMEHAMESYAAGPEAEGGDGEEGGDIESVDDDGPQVGDPE